MKRVERACTKFSNLPEYLGSRFNAVILGMEHTNCGKEVYLTTPSSLALAVFIPIVTIDHLNIS